MAKTDGHFYCWEFTSVVVGPCVPTILWQHIQPFLCASEKVHNNKTNCEKGKQIKNLNTFIRDIFIKNLQEFLFICYWWKFLKVFLKVLRNCWSAVQNEPSICVTLRSYFQKFPNLVRVAQVKIIFRQRVGRGKDVPYH